MAPPKIMTECGTVLSSPAGLQSTFIDGN